MKLELQTRIIHDIAILQCKGRFTYREEAVAFSEAVAVLLCPGGRIVVDMNELEVIDSAGLGELVVVHMWARASGCVLKLAGANARIMEVFELTNLLSVFEIYGSTTDALASFESAGQAVTAA